MAKKDVASIGAIRFSLFVKIIYHLEASFPKWTRQKARSYKKIAALLPFHFYLLPFLVSSQSKSNSVLTPKEKEFSQVINDNQGLIIKISRMYTNTLEDEQDLFQEIVLQLWRSYDTFKGQSKISTWMYRVALNTAITLFRKTTKSPKTDELQDFHYQHTEYFDDEKQHQISTLYKVIKMLPNVERAIVMMYLDDLPYREISENLGISEVNARVKMNRLKKVLKNLMEKHAWI